MQFMYEKPAEQLLLLKLLQVSLPLPVSHECDEKSIICTTHHLLLAVKFTCIVCYLLGIAILIANSIYYYSYNSHKLKL